MYQQPTYLQQKTQPPKNIQLPEIRGSQRVFIVGKTRSGKSTMARYLLKEVVKNGGRVFILDPKKDWQGRPPHRIPYGQLTKEFRGSIDNPIYLDHFDPTVRVAIYCPSEWDKNCDDILKKAIEVGYTTIYIDEIKQLVPNTFAPKQLVIAYTQGAAAGVGIWGGVQRPKGIPEVMKDQAEVWIIFRVKKFEDRIDIASYVEENTEGRKVSALFRNPLQIRWFIFFEDTMTRPVLCMPLVLDKRDNVVKHG
jgi:energy-coupling factor transporter ATP-binding protein EcfA2